MNNKVINSKQEIYVEIALRINKSLYDDKEISYYIYKKTENKLLQMLNRENY